MSLSSAGQPAWWEGFEECARPAHQLIPDMKVPLQTACHVSSQVYTSRWYRPRRYASPASVRSLMEQFEGLMSPAGRGVRTPDAQEGGLGAWAQTTAAK